MSTLFDKFDPKTTQWAGANALALAHPCRLAYQDEASIKATLQQWGFDSGKSKFLNSPHTQGVGTATDEMFLVGFRGTDSSDIWDWMADADVVLRPFASGMVHKGFYEGLE